jgi:hypothetical protein
MLNHITRWINNFKTWISWCISEESNIFKIFLCFMVNELSKYDMGIAFKQKWVWKYWTLKIMEHMEIKKIQNYVEKDIEWNCITSHMSKP